MMANKVELSARIVRDQKTVDFLERIMKALNNKNRLRILAVILEHEGKTDEPLSFTELAQKTNMESNELSYHLKILRQAGFIRQLMPVEGFVASGGHGHRSFYETTSLLLLVLKDLLGHKLEKP